MRNLCKTLDVLDAFIDLKWDKFQGPDTRTKIENFYNFSVGGGNWGDFSSLFHQKTLQFASIFEAKRW